MSLWRNLALTLEMIKWEHSIFALPFALTGAMLAAGGWPPFIKIAWIVVCMVTARTAAMAFNRWADAKIDAENPRTSMRAIPAGLISRRFVLIFWLASSALFLLAAAQLNRLTLLLAPVALAVVLLYSYTKRFTRSCSGMDSCSWSSRSSHSYANGGGALLDGGLRCPLRLSGL